MASAEGWYTDEAIKLLYGDAYDQQQKNDGFLDDANDPEQPYRFLTQWSVRQSPSSASSSSSSNSTNNNNPLPLPNGHFIEKKYNNAYVEGILVPRSNNNNNNNEVIIEPPPLKIKLALNKDDWIAFDRSKDYRGFWLMRSGALYWLQEPDNKSIDDAAAAGDADAMMGGGGATTNKSQEQVQYDHTVWLAVLSNLMDAVFDWTNPQAAQWANTSVTDAYEQLKTPANNDQQPPFDKDLLVRYKDKIKPHLIGAQKYLTKNCAFIKSLNAMKIKKPKKDARKIFTRQQIEASTRAAQERSRQYPWGGPTPEGKRLYQQQQQQQRQQVQQQQQEVLRKNGIMTAAAEEESQPSSEEGALEDDIDDSDSSSGSGSSSSTEEMDFSSSRGGGSSALLGAASQGEADRSKKTKKKKRKKDNVSVDTVVVQAVGDPKPKKLKRTIKKKSGETEPAELEESIHDGSEEDDDSEVSEPRTKKSNKKKKVSPRRPVAAASASSSGKRKGKKDAAGVEYSNVEEEEVVATSSSSSSSSRKRKRPTKQEEAPPPLFSGDEMSKALEFCEPFLHPKPSNTKVDPSSWTSVIDQEFGVRGEEEAKSLLQAARKWGDDKKPEWHLLVVEAFRQSCIRGSTKIMKKMFSKEEYASMLFNQWRSHAMAKAHEEKKLVIEGTTEVFLLTSIVGLIAECKYIKSKNLLDKIKARGVDWQAVVDEVIQFNKKTAGQSQKLKEACAAAQERIDHIKAESPSTDVTASAVPKMATEQHLTTENTISRNWDMKTASQTGSHATPQQSSFSLAVDSGSSQKRRPSVGLKSLLKKVNASASGASRPAADVAKSGTDTAAVEPQVRALIEKNTATATRKDDNSHETAEEARRKKLEEYVASLNSSTESPLAASDSTSNAPSNFAVSSTTTSRSASARKVHAWVDPPKEKKWGSREPCRNPSKPVSLTITPTANLKDQLSDWALSKQSGAKQPATDVGNSRADTTDAKGQSQAVVKKDTATAASKTDCSHKSAAEEEEEVRKPAAVRNTANPASKPTMPAMPFTGTKISSSSPTSQDAKKESSKSRRQPDPLLCPSPKAYPPKPESNKPRPATSSFASLAALPAPKPKVLSEELFGASRGHDGAGDEGRRPNVGHSDDRRTGNTDSRDRERSRSRSSSGSSDDWQSRGYEREPISSRGKAFDDDRRSSGRERRERRRDRNREHYREDRSREHYREERGAYSNNFDRSDDSSHRRRGSNDSSGRRRGSNGYDSQRHVPPARANELPRNGRGGGMGRGKHKTRPAWMDG